MKISPLLIILLLVGCASHSALKTSDTSLPQETDVSDSNSVRTPEQVKAYPVGRYQDPDDPDLMHEGHTVYRAEATSDWNLAPNQATALPLESGQTAVADPSQEHVALSAELEQRLKQEDQLLQATYDQNEKLSQEVKSLQNQRSTPPPVTLQPQSNSPTTNSPSQLPSP